ncbi:phosphotransferase [Formosa sediminum]|uniref:Phosphotransferase n=1 Tax=Formosa sediminum TaxID=2594004 RepID=A0A516GML0_9FLAO|nr:phosphotransferase [Formosa sediminum]QDO92620.1 phosphotransferase [Formosa sediminum]
MSIFPVTTSTLSASALRVFLIETYGFHKTCSCTLFRTGINHTYFVTNQNKRYVYRVYCYAWRSKNQIQEELRLLNLLRTHHINVSYPILANNGDYIQELLAPEGPRYGVLFSFAEGEKVRFMDEKTCYALGELMAKFHKITQGKSVERIQYTAETLMHLPFSYAKEYFKDTIPEMQFIKAQSEAITKVFSEVDTTQLRKGVVHLDVWYDNMNIKDNSNITLFDFDFCGNGWLVLDVAYFCKQLFHIESDKTVYELKKDKFLEGYQSVQKLSNTELNIIPETAMAIWMFYLGVQSQRFDWSNIFLTTNYLKMYIGKMKAWYTYTTSELVNNSEKN